MKSWYLNVKTIIGNSAFLSERRFCLKFYHYFTLFVTRNVENPRWARYSRQLRRFRSRVSEKSIQPILSRQGIYGLTLAKSPNITGFSGGLIHRAQNVIPTPFLLSASQLPFFWAGSVYNRIFFQACKVLSGVPRPNPLRASPEGRGFLSLGTSSTSAATYHWFSPVTWPSLNQ